MKNLFSVVIVIALMFSIYSCGNMDAPVSSENPTQNQLDIPCFASAPVVVGQNVIDGNLVIFYNSSGLTINFDDIPEGVNHVSVEVRTSQFNGNPPVGHFSVHELQVTEGQSFTWSWDTFGLTYQAGTRYYIYVHFELSSGETGWAGSHERRGHGRWLNWTELRCN